MCTQEAMRDFRSGKAQALVATDVAGRGLHIRNLPYVVNYGAHPALCPHACWQWCVRL